MEGKCVVNLIKKASNIEFIAERERLPMNNLLNVFNGNNFEEICKIKITSLPVLLLLCN